MKIGIIGGGQLARMLIQSTLSAPPKHSDRLSQLKWVVIVHKGESFDPIKSLGVEVREILEFSAADITDLDFVTFENEFLDLAGLQKLQHNLATKFFPALDVLKTLQNKIEQKRLLNRLKIPTSPWQVLENSNRVMSPSGVYKWAKGGYDGKGTHICDLMTPQSGPVQLEQFVRSAEQAGTEIYREDFVDFDQEAALVAARNWSGDIVFFPLVETVQRKGVCLYVISGDEKLKALEEKAQRYALTILEELNYVGCLALEFFVKDTELIVNEMAPRVHNSCHYSETACAPSQFEMHVRAGIDEFLERPKFRSHSFAMFNLLGPQSLPRSYFPSELPTMPVDGQIHWYEKSSLKIGRKMGHFNFEGESRSVLISNIQQLMVWERQWHESLTK